MKYKIKIKNPIYGVPITVLNSFSPKQFEILGSSSTLAGSIIVDNKIKLNPQRFYVNGKRLYDRLAIRRLK